jgi:hypothetical protein
MIDTILKDLRFAFRGFLIAANVFAAIAVITLALGIGANSAIFSVVNSIVLRPLPYLDSSRLVGVVGQSAQTTDLMKSTLSAPE